MCDRNVIRSSFVVAVMVALLAAGGPVGAGEEDSGENTAAARQLNWRMRLVGAVVSGGGGFSVTTGDHHGAEISTNGGGGVGINFEYRYSQKMGFEVGAMAVAANFGVFAGKNYPYHGAGVELESFVPITFSFNYHPLQKTDVFDLYLGPLATATFFSNIGVGSEWGGAGVESGVNFGLGLTMGADLNLGRSRWSLNAGLKYIALSDFGGNSAVSYDPLIVTFGFGFRF
jgi:outer membrane protein W